MRYAVINGSGVVVQAIEWDGVASWPPPQGCTIQVYDYPQGPLVIGVAWNNGSPAAPPPGPLGLVIDQSDANNLPKIVRAVLLAAFSGNVAAARAAFLAAWNALP